MLLQNIAQQLNFKVMARNLIKNLLNYYAKEKKGKRRVKFRSIY